MENEARSDKTELWFMGKETLKSCDFKWRKMDKLFMEKLK